jgi:purine nucleosidase
MHPRSDARAARCTGFAFFSSVLLVGLALLTASFIASKAHAADATAPGGGTVHTLIIDTDPGADDVIALLFAMASPEQLKIQALTTVAGNVPLAKTSRNARLAREWAGRPDIPVYAGAPRPLLRTPIHAADIHGSEGITGVEVHAPSQPLADGNAVDYLIRTLRAAPEKSVTLAMLGPETNLALALTQAPDITRGLRELVLMGGAHFNGGNITPTAEFNVFADPHAAEIVLKSGVPITMLPLDLTHKVLTSPERIATLRGIGNQAGRTVADILDAYVQHDMQYYGLTGGPVHDATVVAYLLQPSLFKGRKVNVEVDSREGLGFGQTVVDWYGGLKKPANVTWIAEGDAQGFFDLLTQRIARLL